MTKRRRGESKKAPQGRKRLRKAEMSRALVAYKRAITPEAINSDKNEEITPKVRIGPNLILTGPNRSLTDVVEETDRGSVTHEIPCEEEDSDAGFKGDSEDLLLGTNRRNSKGHVRVYGKQRKGRGREVMDGVMVRPAKIQRRRSTTSEVLPVTLIEQLREVTEKLWRAEQQISQLEIALDEKSEELDAAASFMNVIEPLSGADIIDLAQTFNDEVFQGAAYIAESLGSSRRKHRRVQKSTSREYKQALMSLGPDLLRDLMEEGEDGSSGCFLLQVALQVCMVTFGVNVLQAWSPDADEHKVMDKIYERILSKENQGVAGSWRSVTRRCQISETTHREAKIEALLYTVTDILTVAGCWGREDDLSTFLAKFQGNIARIADSAMKLWYAIGSVTHMDILPMTVPPESRFCREVMANVYASNTGTTRVSESEDRVLGTTELGLEKKVNNLECDTHRSVLLKPKIILRSTLLSFPESEQENC